VRTFIALVCVLIVAACAARPPLSEAGQQDLIVQYAENGDFIKIFKNSDLFGGDKLTDDVALYVSLCCKTPMQTAKLLDDNWFKVTHKKFTEVEQQELMKRRKVDADEVVIGRRMAKPYAPAIYVHDDYITGFYYKDGTIVYSYAYVSGVSL